MWAVGATMFAMLSGQTVHVGENAQQLMVAAATKPSRSLAAVAPGGTLLVVHHQIIDAEQARAHGCDPDDYVSPADVAALLDDSWRIETSETRPRHVTGGAGSHHTHDIVLRARRLN